MSRGGLAILSPRRSEVRKALKFGILIALAIVIQSCASSGGKVRDGVIELVAADHDQRVDLKVGQLVTVRLDANRTTGYTWMLPSGELAQGLVQPLHPESRYDRKIDGIYSMGVGAIEVWEFRAVRAGSGTLRLEYRRPFEQNVDPLRIVDFPLRVTDR